MISVIFFVSNMFHKDLYRGFITLSRAAVPKDESKHCFVLFHTVDAL